MRVGAVYATSCLGCCAGLMAGLFVLGAMSIGGVAGMGAVVLAEKRAASGVALSRAMAVALAVAVMIGSA